MDSISIRPMRESDYEDALALWKETDGIGLSEADKHEDICRYLVRNPDLSQVAESNGILIGAVLCGHDGRRGYFHHLAVAKLYRGNGLGRRLVERCMERLIQGGIDRCHLFVYPDNKEGLAFWRKMGFEQRQDLQLCSRDL